MKKKILSLLLAVLLLTGCLPMTAGAADDAGESYTAGAPAGGNYTISTAAQLKALAETVNGGEPYASTTFTLTDDIDLSAVCGSDLNGGTSWTPIGTAANPFTGIFDGANNEITKLYINEDDASAQALFGYVSGGVVKNLSVDGSATGNSAAILAGAFRENATAENCHTSGSVTSATYAGGVVGFNDSGIIQNCGNSASVSGMSHCGGLAGVNRGILRNCMNTGRVSDSYDAGGLVATNTGTVEKCYNTGVVTTGTVTTSTAVRAGGIVSSNSGGVIANCYNTGAVNGATAQHTGGVAGHNTSNSAITNCYNIGVVNGAAGQHVGGVAAYSTVTSPVTNCYYLAGTADGGFDDGDVPGQAELLTTEEFKLFASFKNWDFAEIWGMSTDENDIRPVLRPNAEHEYDDTLPPVVQKYGGGTGAENDPYIIATAAHLKELADTPADWGEHFKLTDDIDLSTVCGETLNGGTNWTPIANRYANPFSGVFDGGGHKIAGLYIDLEDRESQALFGFVCSGGVVKNLTVDGSVTGDRCIALVAGILEGGVIEDCHTSGSVSGREDVGGVAGFVYPDSLVQNCGNAASVRGENVVGGITGTNLSVVRGCTNTGSISDGEFMGGIAGRNDDTVEACYNTGKVTGNGHSIIGGIVGIQLDDGLVQTCYNIGSVAIVNGPESPLGIAGGVVGMSACTVQNCYNVGKVTSTYSTGGVAGAIAGGVLENCYNYGMISDASFTGGIAANYTGGMLKNCYYLEGKAAGGLDGEDTDGESQPLTADKFAEQTTFIAWNFFAVWEMGKDKDGTPVRPVLKNPKEDPLQALPGEPEPTACGCVNCDESKCNCATDCTGNPCTCAGCPGKPGKPDVGDDTGGGTVIPDDEEPYEPDPACPQDSSCPIAKFPDTNVKGWYHDAVHYVLGNSLMSGTGSTTFEPDSTLSRAMLVQILYNLEGKPSVTVESSFADVSTSAWYADAVRWAAANGVVAGNGDGTFSPESAITREQMAVILRNYAVFKGQSTTASGSLAAFIDGGKTSDWAVDAMQWAVGSGLISGKENRILDPLGSATRAEAATVLMRYCKLT